MPPAEERLDSWKEIAGYLRKGVRTVQRWEQTDGLPVRRLGQDRPGSVFAYKSELDAWWQSRSRTPSAQTVPRQKRARWKYAVAACALSLCTVAAALLAWTRRPLPPTPYQAVPLTAEHGWESAPTFSPDGRQVAYMGTPPGQKPHIFVKTIGSDTQTRLTGATEPEGNPVWSPDGRWIAFIRPPSTGRGWAAMRAPASGGEVSMVAVLMSPSTLAWSPDSQWLLAVDGPPKVRSIVAISTADGTKHALTDPSEFRDSGFGVSPDGRRLIFSNGGPVGVAVYEQPLGPGLERAGTPRPITDRLWISDMRVAADGKQIVYVDSPRDEGSLMRLRLSPGARPETLYTAWGRLKTPAISPDGRRIAFAAGGMNREEIWRLSLANAKEAAAPFISSTHADMNPQYSPDGKQIAFHSTRTGASEIWVVDRDGGNARRLTYTNARTTATPRWSPDGEWIAFESNQAGQSEVYVIPSRGGAARRLTSNPATDAIPRWSRDGRYIYFCSDRTGRFEVWKIPAAGGTAEQLTTEGGFTAVESPDGQWLYYSQTRNYGPILRRALSGGKPEEVAPQLNGLFFAVTAGGVYYEAEDAIWFWEARSGARRKLFAPGKPMGVGLDVSPDGRTLLFTQIDQSNAEADLYLIDGVR